MGNGRAGKGASGDGDTALCRAARKGDLESVERLIAEGALLEKIGSKGETALAEAVWEGRADCVEALIKAGADIEARGRDGGTPLVVAAARERSSSVRLLIAAGADIEALDAGGWTALMRTAGSFSGVFSVKYLLAAGANPKASAVEWSAASLACAEDSAEVLAMLIRAGCVVDHGGERGDTPLARALCVGGTKCVAMLLEAGCDVGWVDDDGRGVLDLAKYCEATYKSERHGICLGMIEADLERRNLMIVAGGPNDAKPTRRM